MMVRSAAETGRPSMQNFRLASPPAKAFRIGAWNVEQIERVQERHSNLSLPARSSSIFTDDGCQLVLPRGVRSRIASSRSQIA